MRIGRDSMRNSDPAGINEIYDSFIQKRNDANTEERYEGNENWFNASSTGLCVRRVYFQSVEQAEKTDLPNTTSKRLMRLGTIVHNDIQESLVQYNTNSNNTISNNTISNILKKKKKQEILEKKKKVKFFVEQEIQIKELNVRGFYDALAEVKVDDKVYYYLYDFKTMASYPWKLKFGRDAKKDQLSHQELQLGTYGYAIQEKYGKLSGMYLMYYNKDTSVVKSITVPLTMVSKAYAYWVNAKKEIDRGLPDFRIGTSPVKEWACNYCPFKQRCNPPNFITKQNRRSYGR